MHTLRNRMIFYGSALAAGFASLGLHRYMMANCFDDKGLLLTGNLPGVLLWVLGIGFFAAVVAMSTTVGGDGTYADNFPPCILSGLLMVAAAGVLAWSVPQLGLEAPGELGTLAAGPIPALRQLVQYTMGACSAWLPYAAAGSMAVLGILRMLGRKPLSLFGALICLFYILILVNNYQLWSADPKLYEYVYPLLAGIFLMLCSFHRTCCDAGVIERKKLIVTGLAAFVCCTGALSQDFMPGFFAASGLWALGSICTVSQLPPDPEEEEATPAEAEGNSEMNDE